MVCMSGSSCRGQQVSTDLRCSHCGKAPNHEGAVPYHTLCNCGDGWFVVPDFLRKRDWDDDRDRDGGIRSTAAEREMP